MIGTFTIGIKDYQKGVFFLFRKICGRFFFTLGSSSVIGENLLSKESAMIKAS